MSSPSPTNTLIVGASSAIALATARLLAARGGSLYLVARKRDRLEAIAADLRVRGASKVDCEIMDLNDFEAHEAMLERADNSLGTVDTVIIAHGTLGDQTACEESVEMTLDELKTNGLSIVALATRIGARFAQRRRGTLVVISSVAGERGRQSNYVYGSAKALVTTFMSGLRQRLYKSGVTVLTIKPGFVDTPMTAAIPKGFLWAKPDAVASGIVKAIDKKKDVVYLPSFWRPIMLAVRAAPEFLFKRLTL